MPDTQTARSGSVALVAGTVLIVGGALGYLLGGGLSGPDVSETGQTSYACALVEKVRAGHQSADDWGPLDEDPAYNELDAVPGLLGVAAPQRDSDADAFAELGWTVPGDPGVDYWEELHERLDATIALCESR